MKNDGIRAKTPYIAPNSGILTAVLPIRSKGLLHLLPQSGNRRSSPSKYSVQGFLLFSKFFRLFVSGDHGVDAGSTEGTLLKRTDTFNGGSAGRTDLIL